MNALVIIDMQRWMFGSSDRMDQVAGLVSGIEQLTAAFEASDWRIYDVRTVHKADRSTWSRLMRKYDYPCLLEGSRDAGPVDGYIPPQGAAEVIKTANSAFLGTNFDEVLKIDGITRLVLVGVFIDGCVGLTAADAAQRGYEVTFIDDAIGHTNADLRAPLFQWLVDDYELELMSAFDFVNAPRTSEPGGNVERCE